MLQAPFDIVGKQSDSHGVSAALRDDEVGEPFGRLYILAVHRFEHFLVAVDDHNRRASSLHAVA